MSFGLNLFSYIIILGWICFEVQGTYECPLPVGQFADPKSCRHFYSCNDNYAYRLFCPEGALYDGAKNDCVDRRGDVKCGPQPTTEAPVTTPDPFVADPCNKTTCQIQNNCFCSSDGTQIPGRLDPKMTPQMIMITFDGSINQLNYDKYNSLFTKNRKNPNGCSIKGTFFMSHQYTNYQLVQKFYSQGHEMAVGTITRRAGLEDVSAADWSDEMAGMSAILNHFAKINESHILGTRGPHLKPGRNAQFESLVNDGFVWDSSFTVPPQPVPVWPYTLDHTYPHECKSGTCPTHPFEGVWEVPMNSHFEDELYSGGFCPYLDQCVLTYLTEDDVLQWLTKDFNRSYNANRAPYMLTLSSTWFLQPHLVKGLQLFIDYSLTLPDVYYLKMTEMIEWMYELATVDQITKDYPWKCPEENLPPPPCNNPNSCRLTLGANATGVTDGTGGIRYMVTCTKCPRVYPWVADPKGRGRKTG